MMAVARSSMAVPQDLKKKIALFCNVPESRVISMPDMDTIYAVPVALADEGLDDQILKQLHLQARERDLSQWFELLERIRHPQGEVRIAVVGKYVQLEDAYKSLREALLHGGLAHSHKTVIDWIESEEIDSAETAAKRRSWTLVKRPPRAWRRPTGSSFPADSASAASRA